MSPFLRLAAPRVMNYSLPGAYSIYWRQTPDQLTGREAMEMMHSRIEL